MIRNRPPGSPPDDLTVIIPHYRHRAGLLRLLRALAAAPWPILVVDDSPAGISLPPGLSPHLRALRTPGATGFARACNAGLSAARTGWALLLNDDALPLGGCTFEFAGRAGAWPCISRLHATRQLCGPVLCGPLGIESAGISVRPWGRVLQQTTLPAPGPDGTSPVDALSGACLHLPASARLDPAFRHGGEDVDLCLRLGGARLIPDAFCWHEGGASLPRRSPEAIRHALSGQLRLSPRARPAVLALCAAQVAREAPRSWPHWRALYDGWKDSGMSRKVSNHST